MPIVTNAEQGKFIQIFILAIYNYIEQLHVTSQVRRSTKCVAKRVAFVQGKVRFKLFCCCRKSNSQTTMI